MRDSVKTSLFFLVIVAALLLYAHIMGVPKDEILQQVAIIDHVILSPGSGREVCEFRVEVSGKLFGYSGSRRNTGNPNAFKTCLALKNGDPAILMVMTVSDLRGRELPEKTAHYAYVQGVKIMIH
jgi:hypothetical protein